MIDLLRDVTQESRLPHRPPSRGSVREERTYEVRGGVREPDFAEVIGAVVLDERPTSIEAFGREGLDVIEQRVQSLGGRCLATSDEVREVAVHSITQGAPAVLFDPPGGMDRQDLAVVMARHKASNQRGDDVGHGLGRR